MSSLYILYISLLQKIQKSKNPKIQKSKNPKKPFFSKVQSPKCFFFLIMKSKIQKILCHFWGIIWCFFWINFHV